MKEIIVFGTGNYYKRKRETINKNYHVIGYLDSAVKSGEYAIFDDGCKIVNPENYLCFPKVPIFLMSVNFFDMWEQLVKLGISEERIAFGFNIEPSYDEFEEEMRKLNAEFRTANNQLILHQGKEDYAFSQKSELQECVRKIYKKQIPALSTLSQLPINPISRRYGREHGTPIDRFFIEKFLLENKRIIQGSVAEFADDHYTRQFGENVTRSFVLHVNGWGENVIKANLVTGEGIEEGMVDCLIATQTIQFIYELDKVAANVYKILRPGGYALITAHGIAQLSLYDYRNWGEYWRFTKMSMERIWKPYFKDENTIVESFGNAKIAMAELYGMAVEDLDISDFQYNDEQYPIVVTALCRKE